MSASKASPDDQLTNAPVSQPGTKFSRTSSNAWFSSTRGAGEGNGVSVGVGQGVGIVVGALVGRGVLEGSGVWLAVGVQVGGSVAVGASVADGTTVEVGATDTAEGLSEPTTTNAIALRTTTLASAKPATTSHLFRDKGLASGPDLRTSLPHQRPQVKPNALGMGHCHKQARTRRRELPGKLQSGALPVSSPTFVVDRMLALCYDTCNGLLGRRGYVAGRI